MRDPTDYESKKIGGGAFARKPVPGLLDKIQDVVLHRGVGYRGWARFRFQASLDDLHSPVHAEIVIVDALGGEHETTLAKEEEHFDDEITYSIKNIRSVSAAGFTSAN